MKGTPLLPTLMELKLVYRHANEVGMYPCMYEKGGTHVVSTLQVNLYIDFTRLLFV